MTVDVDKFCLSLTGTPSFPPFLPPSLPPSLPPILLHLMPSFPPSLPPSLPASLELFSNVLKPTLDILIYARRLQTSVRREGGREEGREGHL